MTETPREPAPTLEMHAEPCRRCGAVDLTEAETRCEIGRDETGEAYCLGGADELPDGRLGYPSPAYIAALDAWCERDLDRMEGKAP